MADGLVVDLDALRAAAEHLRRAHEALVAVREGHAGFVAGLSSSAGDARVVAAGEGFTRRWAYGSRLLGDDVEALVKWLSLAVSAYEEAERQLTDAARTVAGGSDGG